MLSAAFLAHIFPTEPRPPCYDSLTPHFRGAPMFERSDEMGEIAKAINEMMAKYESGGSSI
jgi:hypothetical protein